MTTEEKAMADAGYTFDFDKKELKKIEQPKQEWSEEDNIILSRIIADYERSNEEWFNAQNSLPHGRKINWLKSLRPQKQEQWNEQDIEMIDWLIRCCEKEYEELCNDRYGHQEIVSDLKRDCRKKWDWLESLKSKVVPQKQWKPSEEQMKDFYNIKMVACLLANWKDEPSRLYNGKILVDIDAAEILIKTARNLK